MRKLSIEIKGLYGLLGIFLLLCFLIACVKNENIANFLLPSADFEEQESTMICWNAKFQQVIIPLVTEISSKDHVTLFYNENFHNPARIENLLIQHKANMDMIDLFPFRLEKDNVWIRDYGPSFVQNTKGEMGIIGFEYPHLEYLDYTNFASNISDEMSIPFAKSKLTSTGGGREINGKGTMILIEGYEQHINPGISKEEIEQEYRDRFNQTNFIWLKRGIPQDDFLDHGPIVDDIYGFGVNWHIDEFCRFADAQTILLTEIDSADIKRDKFYAVIHDRLEENYQILRNAVDQDGKPFKIIRLPHAPVIFANGFKDTVSIFYTPITSYLNFVITNHSVIIPKYGVEDAPEWVMEKDEKVKKVMQQAFQNREIKMIDAIDLNYKGGGLHCATLSKPKSKKTNWVLRLFRKGNLG